MSAETRITIEHQPRGQRIIVTSPGGKTEFFMEAPPSVALRALADYLREWSDGNLRRGVSYER